MTGGLQPTVLRTGAQEIWVAKESANNPVRSTVGCKPPVIDFSL